MSDKNSLSFKFVKTSRHKLVEQSTKDKKNFIQEDEEIDEIKNEKRQEVDNKRRKITALDAKGFTEEEEIDRKSDPNNRLIIPPLKNTHFDFLGLNFSSENQNLDDLAKKELLDEAKKFKNDLKSDENEGKKANFEIKQMVSQSRDGGPIDFDVLPESSLESDYESVPIDKFGVALLRGLGWKEGAPIGRTAQKVVKPWTTEPRPKGLGLGASLPGMSQKSDEKHEKSSKNDEKSSKNGEKSSKNGEKSSKNDEEREKLTFKRGAFVEILKPKGEKFGEILSIDDDNARIFVKLASNSRETLNLSQRSVKLITKHDYKKGVKRSRDH